MKLENIDINIDFTTETVGYWDNFWENRYGLGGSNIDPDTRCKTLQLYHKVLWSKKLPNGEVMELEPRKDNYGYYLQWKDFVLSSDTLINEFRWKRMIPLYKELEKVTPNYREYQEEYVRKTYNIGGMIIFPRKSYGINQSKGCNSKICDRVDLFIECVKRYYDGENSPLSDVLNKDKTFFNLFIDFKGYIDYFFLQDTVSDDYKTVKIYLGDNSFTKSPLPQNTDEWFIWHDKTIDFINKRNYRIKQYSNSLNKM